MICIDSNSVSKLCAGLCVRLQWAEPPWGLPWKSIHSIKNCSDRTFLCVFKHKFSGANNITYQWVVSWKHPAATWKPLESYVHRPGILHKWQTYSSATQWNGSHLEAMSGAAEWLHGATGNSERFGSVLQFSFHCQTASKLREIGCILAAQQFGSEVQFVWVIRDRCCEII